RDARKPDLLRTGEQHPHLSVRKPLVAPQDQATEWVRRVLLPEDLDRVLEGMAHAVDVVRATARDGDFQRVRRRLDLGIRIEHTGKVDPDILLESRRDHHEDDEQDEDDVDEWRDVHLRPYTDGGPRVLVPRPSIAARDA